MANIKLTEKEMQYISLFEALTQVEVLDCINDEENNRLIFIVRRGMAGKAIGVGGANTKLMKKLIGKDVEVVEQGLTLDDLIRAALFPAKVLSIEMRENSNGGKVAIVEVPAEQKGLAIGKGGKNVKKAKLLARRYFGVDVALK
ncbi:MAG: NusA-like transcription termination signal-binding factor [Thermofilaceae archaeon]